MLIALDDFARAIHELDGEFLYCPRDGAWVPQERMTAAFTRASRRGHAITGGAGGSPLLVRRGGSATSHLAINRHVAYKPRVHTPFASAFAGRELRCPACAGSPLAFRGDQWTCEICTGSFVENAALAQMIAELTGALWEPPAPSSVAGTRACPACGDTMMVESMEEVAIDRCSPHGVWFDRGELETALAAAGKPPTGWMRRLLGLD